LTTLLVVSDTASLVAVIGAVSVLYGCSVWWLMEAKTLYQFVATNEEELSFPPGVTIKVFYMSEVLRLPVIGPHVGSGAL